MTRHDALNGTGGVEIWARQVLPPLDEDDAAARYVAVIRRLARTRRIRRASATRRFVEMLKFLDACAGSGRVLSPPPRVDDAWHVFILFTREYADYCEQRFGRFIHHEPTEAKNPVAYKMAREEVSRRFGEVDRRIWPECRAGFWVDGLGGDGGGGCAGAGCGGGCGGGG